MIPIINWARGCRIAIYHHDYRNLGPSGSLPQAGGIVFLRWLFDQIGQGAISREDNIAIDTFLVSPRDQVNFSERYARQIFEEGLNKKLASTDFGDSMLDELIETLESGEKESSDPDAPQLSPKVEVYEEISKRKAIVETHSADTPGLLYRLAQVVHSHEFDITSAHIHTERGIAFDELYIKSRDPKRRESSAINSRSSSAVF